MPSKPRSEVFDPYAVGVYHCWNRVVRQRHLLGFDGLTGNDYSHRKGWFLDRLRHLAGSMAIDILDYALLDNHVHFVLRNRPDIVSNWSDEEVARRWWFVCPERKNADGSIPEPRPCELGLLLQKVDDLRERLSSISWLMRLVCQTIAYHANREDGVDGRFFAKRFDCERLKTSADVLACSIYVDLNWIAAGMAETPEESRYTSAFDRIMARWQGVQVELSHSVSLPSETSADAWLAPIYLDETAAAYTGESVGACNPVGAARISNKGFLPMTRDQYLSLLDLLGRIVRVGKRGFIPPELPPILERLDVEPKSWLDRLFDRLGLGRHPPPVAAG